MDHNIPTVNRFDIKDEVAKRQVTALERNCEEFGVRLADLHSADQGIVHVVGELGLTLPGKRSFAETAIHRLTARSERLPSVSAQVRWNMFFPHRHYGSNENA